MPDTAPAPAPPWVTLAQLKAAGWADLPRDDARAQSLLSAALEQCGTYAPVLFADEPVPARYTEAVLLQVRELWAASTRDGTADSIGMEGYAVRVRPLTAAVRQLLRPPQPIGAIG